MGAPPIYAEARATGLPWRAVLWSAALALLPAILGAAVGARLSEVWGIVAVVPVAWELGVLAAVALAVGAWLARAARRLPLWRRAASRALLALVAGTLAWTVLVLGGQSPLAIGTGGVWLAVAALVLYALGEAAGLAAAAAPWPLARPAARPFARALGIGAGLALAAGLWSGPKGAAVAGAGLFVLLALLTARAVVSASARGSARRVAPCPRCGAGGRFERGVTPCTACGLLVRWDGVGDVTSGSGSAR